MAFQLLRTNVSLTGNVSICASINNSDIDRVFLSRVVPDILMDTGQLWSRDLPFFYKERERGFWSQEGECERGVRRISVKSTGKQFTFFAPVYIESRDDLPDAVRLSLLVKNQYGYFNGIISSKTINIKDSYLYNYIYNSFGETELKSINISPTRASIQGMGVKSEGMHSYETSLPKRLFAHDMTLIEADRLIAREFEMHDIVLSNIININFLFDIEDFIPIGPFVEMEVGKEVRVKVEYLKGGDVIDISDVDVNHRFLADASGNNIYMKYPSLHDPDTAPAGRITPKWCLSGSDNKYIFNVYRGLSARPHQDVAYGFDPYTTTPLESSHNLDWMSYLYKGMKVNTDFNNPVPEDHFVNTIALNTGLGVDYSLRSIYKSAPYRFKRVSVDNGKFVYNGFKYSIDKEMLSILLSETNPLLKINDNINISFNYIDNIKTVDMDLALFVLVTKDNGMVTACDFVMWLPVNTKTGLYIAANDPKIHPLVFSKVFGGQSNIKYYIINTDNWSKAVPNTPLPRALAVFKPMKQSAYKVERPLVYEEGSGKLYETTAGDIYMERYYGWLEPSLINADKKGRLETDSFIGDINLKPDISVIDKSIIYIPKTIRKRVPVITSGSMDDIYKNILKDIFPINMIDDIIELYDITLDTNDNKSLYIITFTLK